MNKEEKKIERVKELIMEIRNNPKLMKELNRWMDKGAGVSSKTKEESKNG